MDNEITINGEVYVKKQMKFPGITDKNAVDFKVDLSVDESFNPKYSEINGKRYPKEALERVRKEYEKPWPQEGDMYYYVQSDGLIWSERWIGLILDKGRMKIGNLFRTKEEAQMYSLRIESLSKGFMPKDSRKTIWFWNFEDEEAEVDDFPHERLTVPYFPTKEECQEWYDKYGSSWEYLLNNKK